MVKKWSKLISLFLILLTLVSCAAGREVPALEFSSADGTEILCLQFENGEAEIQSVGSVEVETGAFKVDGPYVNASSDRESQWWLYEIPERYFDLAAVKTIKGVLVYRGFAYCVVDEYEKDMLYRLSDNTAADWEALSWDDFYNFAAAWNEKNAEVSGGEGLGLI